MGGGGAPPSPPGSVPPWITSGFSWSRVGLAKWFIRMQGSDTSRLACFFKDLQSILWQCFTWKARYCNASLLLSPLSLSPQPYLSSTSRASSSVAGFLHDSAFKVFQLDRVTYDDRGHPKKLDTPLQVESQVHLPCFVDERDTAYELVAYDVVAVVYHSGTTSGGHLQAGLRAGPPTQWHSTDDGRMATYHPTLLKAVAKNLVQIWVVKHDVMGTSNPPQHLYDPSPPDCPPDAGQGLHHHLPGSGHARTVGNTLCSLWPMGLPL